jgi:hypothetical protein
MTPDCPTPSVAESRSACQPPQNPFATRFIRPGAMPFLFPLSIDTAQLVERLAELDWRGAIIGPHGSGKSTLLAELRPELIRGGRRIAEFALHNGQRRLPIASRDCEAWDEAMLVIVDGYEQLSASSRWRLDRLCRRAGSGLLVTSHQPTPLPELLQTAIDVGLLEQIVARLTRDNRRFISPADVARAFLLHGQNAREALFWLYDLHERRWREVAERL